MPLGRWGLDFSDIADHDVFCSCLHLHNYGSSDDGDKLSFITAFLDGFPGDIFNSGYCRDLGRLFQSHHTPGHQVDNDLQENEGEKGNTHPQKGDQQTTGHFFHKGKGLDGLGVGQLYQEF